MVAAAGIEPASLDYQSSALPLGYTAIEDWLWRKDSNLRMAALTVRCLTSLATPQEIGGCGWNRTTNLALMRRMLCPFELHSRFELGARGGVEPRAFRPALRFGLEDRGRERGPRWRRW